jgi:hypothetical protein
VQITHDSALFQSGIKDEIVLSMEGSHFCLSTTYGENGTRYLNRGKIKSWFLLFNDTVSSAQIIILESDNAINNGVQKYTRILRH